MGNHRSESEEPFKPVQFGRYFLEERLAVGGMAEIFRAKSRGAHGFEKTLVVKRILSSLAADQSFIEMFIDEARVMVKLNHPKVVQVLDFGEEEGQYYIAMEYIHGIDGLGFLRKCVQQGIRPSISLAVHIIAEVLDGLHYAHTLTDENGRSLNIIHRDISPSNIFISSQGEVKLGDFGIARAAIRTSASESRSLKGKYGYLAPEVVSGGVVDQRADVFSTGIVLAEFLMVRRLFVAKSDLEVLLQVRDARLDRLDKYGRHIPSDLRQIIESALARNPTLRYQDAAMFRDALHCFLYEHRRMVRHTDVREFVGRLMEARPLPLQAAGERGVAREPPPPASVSGQEPADGSTPSGGGLWDWMAGVLPHSEEPVHAEPPTPKTPLTTPSRDPVVAALQGVKPAGPTEYSAASRERITVRPRKEKISASRKESLRALSRMSRARAETDSALPDAPSPQQEERTPENLASALEELAQAESPLGDYLPRYIGQKRKISIGPPSRPPPVPAISQGSTSEENLPLEALAEVIPEIDRIGTDSAWDRTGSPSSSPDENPRLPHIDVEVPTDILGPEQVAASIVGSPLGALSQGQLPDMDGQLSQRSLISVLFSLALSEETGMLGLQVGETIKEVYLVHGDPQYIASNRPDELFGQLLVRRGVISEGELAMALAMLPHFDGSLGHALVELKLLRPVQVIRQLTHQVRERLLDAFSWKEGRFIYLRGRRCEHKSAPLGLDAFELIGEAVIRLPEEAVRRCVDRIANHRPCSVSPPPVPPEVFRLRNRPREVFDMLDGRHTLAEMLQRFDDPEQEADFVRMVCLLLETGLAKV